MKIFSITMTYHQMHVLLADIATRIYHQKALSNAIFVHLYNFKLKSITLQQVNSSSKEGCLFFNFYYNFRIQKEMKSKRLDVDKWVYKFTKPTIMKFQPAEDYEQPEQKEGNGILNRLKTFFSPPSKPKLKSPIKRMNSISPEHRSPKKNTSKKPILKYVKRLTNEHVLIGNEDQLDATCISGIIHEFVDTEFLWSINIKKAILQIAIDYKKNYIILLPEKQVIVFSFDPKLIHQKPTQVGCSKLKNDVKFVQIVKDSTFVLCYATGIQVYAIDQLKGIRVTLQKKYDLPSTVQLNLLQIPHPFENILNVFFEQYIEGSKSIGLWNSQIQFFDKEIRMSKATKIYDIPGYLKKTVRLQNYSKDIYFINLGRQIYAVRKGYIIDSVNVNISIQGSYLKYISHQKLIHISANKIQVYIFKVDLSVNPPRLVLSSSDSIEIPHFPGGYQYVEAVEILGENFAVFYQTKEEQNRMLHGELKYAFIVSHLVKLEDKIREILPHEIKNLDIQLINQRADMAGKMGLQRKDIYLRLWNNSQKTQVQDYKILLDTLDYDTIKVQIEKKLKKASMNLRQMILLEQGCLSMLHQNVFGVNCTKQDIKNYFISHILIRKLELYRLISSFEKKEGKQITEDDQGKLLINIQNYNYYKTIDIKTMLLEYIYHFCMEQKDKNEIMKIRVILRHFKFALRINYQDLLQQIIKKTKKKFLKLLQALPQLLPFQHSPNDNEQQQQKSRFEGVWGETTSQQWQKHLYIDSVLTIDNKQALAQVCNSVWFKRYWLSQHQFVNSNRKQIQEIYDENCSDSIYYHVIDCIFENITDYPSVRGLVDFIQNKYEKMPQHIFGKIFLYRKLFEQFKQNQKINKTNTNINSFREFLRLKDDDIFKVMFSFEKIRKNFILKEMKPHYMILAGNQVFNQGLLSYFASDKSEISDIKYLLNRMNNQKIEFHQENEGIYQVLIRGMQLKLKLGSSHDIPIDEVLIYIQNIPLSKQNLVLKDLQIMKLINEQSQRFRKIHLNMSIFQMTKNVDNVIASLVLHQIKQCNLMQMRQYAQIRDVAHRIISDVQQLKQKIFPDSQSNELTLFSFLTVMLEQQAIINCAGQLLEDDWINRNFNVNQIMIESLVLYMYKWRMNIIPSYEESSTYLKEIVTLLPAGNKCRQFIEAEIEFSQILSTPEHNIYYPLSGGNQYFTIIQLENIINNTPGSHLMTINIQKLHQCTLKIQQISTDSTVSDIKLHDIYQIAILRLIECDMLREVVQRIRTLIQIQGQSNCNFIYPALLVAKIAPQMIQQNKNLLLKCLSYLFNKPLVLLEILDKIMNVKATSSEFRNILIEYYQKIKIDNLTFSKDCILLEPLYLKLLITPQLTQSFITFIRHTLIKILIHKQQFSKPPEFFIIFTILCNDPYVLVKYLYCNKYKINIKDFRCFLSFLIKQQIIDRTKLLQLGKRLFFIIYEAINKNKSIDMQVEEFRKIPLEISREIDRIKDPKTQFEKKISKSLDRLKLKSKAVANDIKKKREKGLLQTDESKEKRFMNNLINPKIKKVNLQYPFVDSDDNPKTPEPLLKKQTRHNLNNLQIFDPKYERQSLLKRTVKQIGLYLSIQKQKQQRSLYYTQKFINDGIYASLGIDKRVENVIADAINQALRESVKKSRRKLRIGKVSSHYVDINSLNLVDKISDRRSQAVSNITEEQLIQIQKAQEEIIRDVKSSDLGNILAQAKILDEIIKKSSPITDKTIFNFQRLDQYKSNQNFPQFLKEIIKIIYQQDLPFIDVLHFLKHLQNQYKQAGLVKQWIDVYIRAENLQNKFSLNLPIRKIMKLDGLYLQSQFVQRLYNFLLPYIVEHTSDQNILKICKVMNLAFKKPDLEQQILFRYLLQLLIKYQRIVYNADIQKSQLKMEREKIYSIVNKIPIKLIISRQQQIIKELVDPQTRKQIIQLIADCFKKRYDQRASYYMQQKWIQKRPGMRYDQ